MPIIKVIKAGLQTTVQDLGRFGYSHLGISISGAADPVSMRIGNLLVGNNENDAALEMTLIGGEFEFDEDTVIAITGANFHPKMNGIGIPMWTSVRIKSGQVLKFTASSEGARCYLCIQGGIDVKKILRSSSTHILTKLGGFEGRRLKNGDEIYFQNKPEATPHLYQFKKAIAYELMKRDIIRITTAPQSDYFSEETLKDFCSNKYEVKEDSNRMGLRLKGNVLLRQNNEEIITEGVTLGAVQVSHDGQPIILFVEHQTTGGYPKIANVISADIHRVGQLRPRDKINFSFISIDEAYKYKMELESIISVNSFVKL